MEYKFLFSVIVPVYNTEKYLAETIESVLSQTVGFEKNIEIILVNNATEDNSGAICEYYQSIYPYNIQYIVLDKNRGPSGARNIGKNYARGKYINFLDSDDKWDIQAFENVLFAFDLYGEYVPFVSCRMKRFGARNDWGFLDFKYKSEGIIDCIESPYHLQMSLCSCFIKSEILQHYHLDERIRHSEDAVFLTKILIEKRQYALVPKAIFYYRSRETNTSAMQYRNEDISWYLNTPQYGYLDIINQSIEKYRYLLQYIQNYLCIELSGRIQYRLIAFMTDEQRQKYILLLKHILQYIDDSTIINRKDYNRDLKILVLSLKHGNNMSEQLRLNHNGWYTLWGRNIFSITNKYNIILSSIDIVGSKVLLYGRIQMPLHPSDTIEVICDNGNTFPLSLSSVERASVHTIIDGSSLEKYNFSVEIEVNNINYFGFQISKSQVPLYIGFTCGPFAKLNDEEPDTFYAKDGIILKRQKNTIVVKYRHHFLNELCLYGKILKKYSRKTLLYRIFLFILKKIKASNKQIWLIADRVMAAGDNGESFFKYLIKHKNKSIVPFFVLSRKSSEFDRLKKTGKVIPRESLYYLFMLGLCDKYISSNADDPTDIFGNHRIVLKDCFDYKRIYLQHGIMKDDHTDSLNRYKKNYAMICTMVKKEHEALLQMPYGYTEKQAKLTGQARYDDLYDTTTANVPKKLLLAPTWRNYLSLGEDIKTGKRIYNPKFKESQYFHFYNNLINDSRLLLVMKKNGWIGEFCAHPAAVSQSVDFIGNDIISIHSGSTYYPEKFAESFLLVTDYSSVFFDFAYLKKPIIFTQYDHDDFFSHHSYSKGYFDYECDGFGPVCYDYESTIKEIINAIENECVMEEKYTKRVDEFFEYHDGKNCERIYQEILKLDEEWHE